MHVIFIYRWGNIEFPLPFGRVMSSTEAFIHGLDEKVNKIITSRNHEFIELRILFLNNFMLFVCLFSSQTSASLKFTVLNPKGRIWTMVAGGGASVIYADTVCS